MVRAVLALAMLLVGLSAVAEAQPAPGFVSGRVVASAGGVALPDADVWVDRQRVALDDAGAFTLAVAAGRHEIVAFREGFAPSAERVEVRARGTVRLVIALSPRGAGGAWESLVRARRLESDVPSEPSVAVSGEELRTVPGTTGDPLRVVETLAGVTPYVTGLPYVSIRGAPPTGTRYALDGLEIPALYHVAFGPAVVPAALIESVRLHAGAAPLELGRHVGGVVIATTRPLAPERPRLAWDVRLVESSALVETPVAPGLFASVSGRYGYPNWVVQALSPEVDVTYGDYQARVRWVPSPKSALSLMALGSVDDAQGVPAELLGDPLQFQFHRVALRGERRGGRHGLGVTGGLWLGYDASSFGRTRLASWSAGPRVTADWAPVDDVRFRVGLDAEVRQFPPPGAPDWVSEGETIGSGRDLFYAAVRERDATLAGAFGEVSFRPRPGTVVTLGLRGDVHAVAGDETSWMDARVSLRTALVPGLALTGGVGTYHQPQSFLIDLPGWTSFALDRPPQRAVQVSNGIEVALPWALSLEAQAFAASFAHLSEYDASEGWPSSESELTDAEILFPERSGLSYGIEIMLRRALAERVTGWVSYTLSRSERIDDQGQRDLAGTDRAHVLNVLGTVDLGGGFRTGARLHVRSGWPYTRRAFEYDMILYSDREERLPPFARIDLRLDKTWRVGAGFVGAFAEVINVGFARDTIGVKYDRCGDDCPRIETTPPLVIPTLGIRGEL